MATTIKYGAGVVTAKAFLDRFTSGTESLYVAFARGSVPWTAEPTPDAVNDTGLAESDFLTHFEGMEKVEILDLGLVVPRNKWTANTVYVPFDPTADRSTAYSENFYVTVDDGGILRVYECKTNNNGAPSTAAPSGTVTGINPGDGYTWDWLYDISFSNYTTFMATNEGTASEWMWVDPTESSSFYEKLGAKYLMVSTKVTDLVATADLTYRQIALWGNVRDAVSGYYTGTSTRLLTNIDSTKVEFITLENKGVTTIATGDTEQVVIVLEF